MTEAITVAETAHALQPKEIEKADFSPKQLPIPSGYQILIAIPDAETESEGGIIKPDMLVDREKTASIVGFVQAMGPDCYRDEQKFPTGPWCEERQFVLFRAYTGLRFKIHGHEYRLINDDAVAGVVDDPRGYRLA